MHNRGLAGDINLPLLALFIYLFVYFTHSFPVSVGLSITLHIIDISMETDKDVSVQNR